MLRLFLPVFMSAITGSTANCITIFRHLDRISVENHLYQVTIISDISMDGDALSTTCFSLGLKKGMQLVEQTDGVEAIFVSDDGTITCSSGINRDDSIQFHAS